MTRASGATLMAKAQADSVPLPLAKGMYFALDDLIRALYGILKKQERISGQKFAPIESRFVDMSRKYDVSKTGSLQLEEFQELVSDGLVWRSMLLPQSTASGELPSPTKKEIEEFRRKIVDKPWNYIAQPTLALSTCPIFTKKGLVPRHVDLRPFVLVSPDKIDITPGGLTRVALKEGSLVVNSSQGGGTKDTWVLKD